jgi:ribonuclease BN (tRNA processing enzyme)
VKLVEYQDGVDFAINGATVEPVKVVHGELRASGFIVEKAGKKIGFSGDSIMCDGIQKIVEVSDWAVLDTSCPKSGSAIHMGLDDIYGLCRTYPDKKIVATHLFEETRKTIQQDAANLIVPDDGDVFAL